MKKCHICEKEFASFNALSKHIKLHHKIDLKEYYDIIIMTAKEIWDRDLKKKTLAEEKGYLLFTIWENDVKIDLENALNTLYREIINEIK